MFIMCLIYKICSKNVPLLHTQWGETAVYKASFDGNSEVVKLLVKAGADLELPREVYILGNLVY